MSNNALAVLMAILLVILFGATWQVQATSTTQIIETCKETK